MIKAVIFDSDGVLVDTEEVNTQAFLEISKKFGIELTPEELKEHQGLTSKEFLRRVLERRKRNEDSEILAKEKSDRVQELLKQTEIPVFEGVRELIKHLKERGVKVAVATSASQERADLTFQVTGLNKEMDAIITGSEIVHSKPNPEIFLMVAQKLNVEPHNAIVIEDATAGVEAAKNAGMFCIGKDNHTGQDLTKADLVVETLKDIDVDQLLNSFQ